MGTKTVLCDDLDQTSPADETVRFRGPDGLEREIDLTADHAKQLREAQEEYAAAMIDFVDAGRLVDVKPAVRRTARNGRSATKSTRASGRGNGAQNEAIREWAQRNGYGVAARGRISKEVREAFQRNEPAAPTLVEAPAAAATGRRRKG